MMNKEIEKLYWDINKDELVKTIISNGGELLKEEVLQKRVVYDFGKTADSYSWLRLRDEGGKVKLTYKLVSDNDYAKELEILVDDFEKMRSMLSILNQKETSYQENKRLKYKIANSEITIDTWPHLDPVCEIESPSEDEMYSIEKMLELDSSKSINQNINYIYMMKYGMTIEDLDPADQLNFTLTSSNPFVKS